MRELRLIAVCAALVGTLVLAGCGDDDNAPPGDPDAGLDADVGTMDGGDGPDASDPDGGGGGDPDGGDPDGGTVGIECGEVVCSEAEECCQETAAGTVIETCVEPGTCTGRTVTCDSSADCDEGQVCCATAGQSECVEEESCAGAVDECTDESECAEGEQCCEAFDIGSCDTSCDFGS